MKTGRGLKTLAHREETLEEMTNSGINFEVKVIRKEEGLVERRGIRIYLGLEDITLSERSQTQKATYYVVLFYLYKMFGIGKSIKAKKD